MATNFSFDEITNDLEQSFKGFELNKGTLLLMGVGVVVILVIINNRQPTQQSIEPETIPDVELSGYPSMNQQDINDTFANYSSAVLQTVQGTLDDYHQDIMETITENQEESYKYIDQVQQGIQKQLGTDTETVERKNSAAWTIGYGLHGEGNPHTNTDFTKDRTALKTEIERTISVIDYRTKQGLDITNQTAHLNNLRKI